MGFLQHRAGDRIKGRYEVLEHLGGGNFGSVYRVRDAAVGNELACKELHVLNNPNTPTDERESGLALFKREALTLATLRHPHIPAAYFEQEEGEWNICPVCGFDFHGAKFCPDHGTELLPVTQRHYLMMDYIDGPTLEAHTTAHLQKAGRPLPEGQCLEWMAQVASALRTLHLVGIVHRDIKPENIKIRTSDGGAVLLDFGLTRKVEEAGGYGTARLSGSGRFGTPGYAPPSPEEQKNPERRSDIYALGMTLYRLVSGRDPQDAEQLAEMRSHLPRHFNVALSPEAERIIKIAAATKPEDRYQNLDDFLADVNDLRAPKSTLMQTPPFTFSDGSRARTMSELARQTEAHPGEATNYLFNGMLRTWLLQNGFAAPAKAAEDVVLQYPKHPRSALELFRRALYPTNTPGVLPDVEVDPPSISFGVLESGETVTRELKVRNVGPGLAWGSVTVQDAPGIQAPSSWEGNGETLTITLHTHSVAARGYSGSILLNMGHQSVRVPVTYTIVPLQLRTIPSKIDMGMIPVGTKVTNRLKVERTSPHSLGVPRGTIIIGDYLSGLHGPEEFEGERPFEITVDAARPGVVATTYEGAVLLDTNGGRLRVPITYTLTLPLGRLLALICGPALLGGVLAGVLRLAYAIVNPDYFARWLVFPGSGAAPFETKNIGPLVVSAAAGLWAALRLTKSNFLSKETRRQFGQSLPFLGLLAGGALSWPLAFALHWSVWLLGDWLLAPFFQSAGSFWRSLAPVAWAASGAFVGFLLGIGRTFEATGRQAVRYGIYGGLGMMAFALFVNALLNSAK
jgi:serine/threonine protein kinase